jgi:hypothetical protein
MPNRCRVETAAPIEQNPINWSAVVPEAVSPSRRVRRATTIAAFGAALAGCSSSLPTLDNLNPLNRPYSNPFATTDHDYFTKRDAGVVRVVRAEDLIGPDGRCAVESVPAAPGPLLSAPAAVEPAPLPSASNRALYFTAGPQAGRTATASAPAQVRMGPSGVGLGMTECEVVRIAGYTDRVEIGSNERGQRSVVLTYLSGERPGIYRFVGGRLTAMERVAEPPAPRKPARPAKTVRK